MLQESFSSSRVELMPLRRIDVTLCDERRKRTQPTIKRLYLANLARDCALQPDTHRPGGLVG